MRQDTDPLMNTPLTIPEFNDYAGKVRPEYLPPLAERLAHLIVSAATIEVPEKPAVFQGDRALLMLSQVDARLMPDTIFALGGLRRHYRSRELDGKHFGELVDNVENWAQDEEIILTGAGKQIELQQEIVRKMRLGLSALNGVPNVPYRSTHRRTIPLPGYPTLSVDTEKAQLLEQLRYTTHTDPTSNDTQHSAFCKAMRTYHECQEQEVHSDKMLTEYVDRLTRTPHHVLGKALAMESSSRNELLYPLHTKLIGYRKSQSEKSNMLDVEQPSKLSQTIDEVADIFSRAAFRDQGERLEDANSTFDKEWVSRTRTHLRLAAAWYLLHNDL